MYDRGQEASALIDALVHHKEGLVDTIEGQGRRISEILVKIRQRGLDQGRRGHDLLNLLEQVDGELDAPGHGKLHGL